jgi:hypothetical protein
MEATTNNVTTTIAWYTTTPEPRWSFCAQCGKKLKSAWKYCPTCGGMIGQPVAPYYEWYIYPNAQKTDRGES